MIVVIPPHLYGRIGAVLSALIIVLSAIGLTLHRDVYAHSVRRDFYCYYTNLSNLLVLVYFAAAAPFLYAMESPLIPIIEFSVAMSIALTHIVFHFILLPALRHAIEAMPSCSQTRLLAADNLLIHYIVPWLTILYWLLCSPRKDTLTLKNGLLWLLFPAFYAGAILLRARFYGNLAGTDSPYPYPFMDVHILGAKRVALTCLRLFILFSAVSCMLVGGIHLLADNIGVGHPLVLI